jgi:hypothetical protein
MQGCHIHTTRRAHAQTAPRNMRGNARRRRPATDADREPHRSRGVACDAAHGGNAAPSPALPRGLTHQLSAAEAERTFAEKSSARVVDASGTSLMCVTTCPCCGGARIAVRRRAYVPRAADNRGRNVRAAEAIRPAYYSYGRRGTARRGGRKREKERLPNPSNDPAHKQAKATATATATANTAREDAHTAARPRACTRGGERAEQRWAWSIGATCTPLRLAIESASTRTCARGRPTGGRRALIAALMRGPGADVGRGGAQSRRRWGMGEPSHGVDVMGVSPFVVQMRQRRLPRRSSACRRRRQQRKRRGTLPPQCLRARACVCVCVLSCVSAPVCLSPHPCV